MIEVVRTDPDKSSWYDRHLIWVDELSKVSVEDKYARHPYFRYDRAWSIRRQRASSYVQFVLGYALKDSGKLDFTTRDWFGVKNNDALDRLPGIADTIIFEAMLKRWRELSHLRKFSMKTHRFKFGDAR